MNTSYHPLRKRVFTNKKLEQGVKFSLASSLFRTRLFFNAAVWSPVRFRCTQAPQRTYSYLRDISDSRISVCSSDDNPQEHDTNVNVLRVTGQPTAGELVMLARFRYLARVLQHARPIQIQLFFMNSDLQGTQIRILLTALSAMHSAMPWLESLPKPSVDFKPWFTFVSDFPNSWKRIVATYHEFFSH